MPRPITMDAKFKTSDYKLFFPENRKRLPVSVEQRKALQLMGKPGAHGRARRKRKINS